MYMLFIPSLVSLSGWKGSDRGNAFLCFESVIKDLGR